ncbi:accessory Sec system protein Asp1 [Streptococcus plurextorum]|uniref:accessory Sec system protein Asp1 n=1 Tax=Streptococcus plurextorum TaxID=456876 RepID=UPI0003FDE7DD|nr:accessory Sec system protein Asp1 [Streptococcus plurextorum]
MYYLVPSWYGKERPYYQESPLWFRVFERMSFDDTINHYQIFKRGGEETCLLTFTYQPQLRYFFHKQDMVGARYWSFFDDIQNITATETKAIDYQKLKWEKGISFIYNPFTVIAVVEDEVRARIHFAENGNLLLIEWLEEGSQRYTYLFDDRGFLSSIIYFDEKQNKTHQDYLNPRGVWQIREFFTGDEESIIVNPDADKRFEKEAYTSWKELLEERLRKFKVKYVSEADSFIVAANVEHNDFLLKLFAKSSMAFSFFGGREDLGDLEAWIPTLVNAKLLIVDTESSEQTLRQYISKVNHPEMLDKVSRISPFDTRLRLGHSQYIKELLLYFFIDNIPRTELYQAISLLLPLMARQEKLQLKLVTFETSNNLQEIEKVIREQIITHYPIEQFMVPVEEEDENKVDQPTEMTFKSIFLERFSNENHIIAALDKARLIIDLGLVPDPYTQIAGISAGVPQINRVKTEYVDHLKNGWVLEDLDKLPEAISYYVDGLANWNAALVYAVQKMSDYTSGRILAEWKNLLNKGD